MTNRMTSAGVPRPISMKAMAPQRKGAMGDTLGRATRTPSSMARMKVAPVMVSVWPAATSISGPQDGRWSIIWAKKFSILAPGSEALLQRIGDMRQGNADRQIDRREEQIDRHAVIGFHDEVARP